MDVRLGNRHMTVISMNNFFGKEAKKYSCEDKYGRSNGSTSCFDNFWEEMDEDITKQCSSGKAHE